MDTHNLLNIPSNFRARDQQNIELKSLLNTLKHIEKRADASHEILYAARKAIEYHSAVSTI